MKNVAVATALIVAATAAATFLLQISRAQRAERDEARAQYAQFARQFGQIERTLANMQASGARPSDARPSASDNGAGVPKAVPAETPEKRVAHEESLQAGNAMIDRAIADGVWHKSDFPEFFLATPDLTVEERGQMLSRLSRAINAGQLRPELRSPHGAPAAR